MTFFRPLYLSDDLELSWNNLPRLTLPIPGHCLGLNLNGTEAKSEYFLQDCSNNKHGAICEISEHLPNR